MANEISPTAWAILLIAVAIAAYDLMLLVTRGKDSTISVVLYHAAKDYPIIPFVLGVLAGHLFWPVT